KSKIASHGPAIVATRSMIGRGAPAQVNDGGRRRDGSSGTIVCITSWCALVRGRAKIRTSHCSQQRTWSFAISPTPSVCRRQDITSARKRFRGAFPCLSAANGHDLLPHLICAGRGAQHLAGWRVYFPSVFRRPLLRPACVRRASQPGKSALVCPLPGLAFADHAAEDASFERGAVRAAHRERTAVGLTVLRIIDFAAPGLGCAAGAHVENDRHADERPLAL